MTAEHKPGCPATGGYGDGISPCESGPVQTQAEALLLADQAWSFDASGHSSTKSANAEMLCMLQDCASTIRKLVAENEQLRAERDRFELALTEWIDKTEWVQKTVRPRELGMHRADILLTRVADLLRTRISDLDAAQAEAKHWRSNHDNVAARLRVFTQRPDLPKELADRLPWYRELVRLQELEAQAQPAREPMASTDRRKLLGSYFAETWAQEKADQMLEQAERFYGITGGSNAERRAECGYQHGHAIGCVINPVDAAIRARGTTKEMRG